MAVFVSYSSRDRALLAGLLAGLRRAHEQVWFDEDLSGGETWWRAILDQIRNCDLFIVALSQNLLDSKACQAELRYANALGKPILPVQVGEVEGTRTHPFAATQVIDYRHPSMETGIQLVTNVHAARTNSQPLPDPLPDEPPIPFAYLMRLAADIAAPALTSAEQADLVAQLKAGLIEDGDDESARADIAQLFRQLRDRPDVTYRTRTEVDSVLETINSSSSQAQAEPQEQQPAYQQQPTYYQPPSYQDQPTNPHAPVYRQPAAYEPQYVTGPVPLQPQRSSRRAWLLAGVGALVAVIVVVIVVIVVVSGSNGGPKIDKADLPSLLLGSDDINSIAGVTLTSSDVVDHMDDSNNPTVPCALLDGTAIKENYDGTGYTAVADQSFSAEDPKMWMGQTVVVFDSADQATALVNNFEGRWKNCAGKTATTTTADETQTYAYGDVTRSGAQLTQTATKEGSDSYSCQHVLRAVGNVVIEADTCGDQMTDQSTRVVDKIAANINAKAK